ncbi:MAG: helicase, partial [Spirochaetaceae bacterium]|nr:helicase [Spirochaetaceae bacterium]
MKTPSDRVQKIIKWREVITALPDQIFYDLVRMHLGEIKTPYSKQKLIEDLGIFLQKDEHKETILALLSPFDESILAAVTHIPSCTGETLAAFFADMPYSVLNDEILNLEERLLLYR